jgi:hypothetical protein
MDFFWPITLFCGWHLLVFGLGVWIGYQRPWRWRIVRDGGEHGTNSRTPYTDEQEVFTRVNDYHRTR